MEPEQENGSLFHTQCAFLFRAVYLIQHHLQTG